MLTSKSLAVQTFLISLNSWKTQMGLHHSKLHFTIKKSVLRKKLGNKGGKEGKTKDFKTS